MPRLIPSLLILAVAASATAAEQPAATLTLASAGKAVASAPLPSGWSVVDGHGGKLVILPAQKRPHVQVWPVDAASVAAAENTVGPIIASEVTNFAPSSRTDLTVAGHPARQLTGTGVEADDGDPGNAEVTLFSVGSQVFVLVAHGEGAGVADRHAELATVLSALHPR